MRATFLDGRLLLAVCLAACSGSTVDMPDGGAPTDAPVTPDGRPSDAAVSTPPETIGPEERPARLAVPRAYDGVTPLPAVILLHGYSASGALQDTYFGLSRAAATRGVYVVIPDGTVDGSGRRFWNATPACCDFGQTGVDDVAYLTSLMDELAATVPVSVFHFVGHSNGGFMSYRMACERSSRIGGIVSLAGSDFWGDEDCVPEQPVSVLQIHGDLDATIQYDGVASSYPSAPRAVERWAGRAGCNTAAASEGERLDLDTGLAGADTDVLTYTSGCGGAVAELWSIRGGSHIPALGSAFAPAVLDWLAGLP